MDFLMTLSLPNVNDGNNADVRDEKLNFKKNACDLNAYKPRSKSRLDGR
jgi:flagellar basal body rod protein FlgB